MSPEIDLSFVRDLHSLLAGFLAEAAYPPFGARVISALGRPGRRRQLANNCDLLPVNGHLRCAGEPVIG